jgi:hypothetical protein
VPWLIINASLYDRGPNDDVHSLPAEQKVHELRSRAITVDLRVRWL